ncbi:MAG TPA: hypothetical protein DEP66_02345, partial [Acidimicrobiaceae bacterium]|nr:hypothetical protein [Acidimicrobiaceae bacterium]
MSTDTRPLLRAAVDRLVADRAFAEFAQLRDAPTLRAAEDVRPFLVAGLAVGSGRRPLLVVVPTAVAAQRMAEDLRTWLGAAAVAELPAWETLPFERVSPDVATMGRRLEVVSRLALSS